MRRASRISYQSRNIDLDCSKKVKIQAPRPYRKHYDQCDAEWKGEDETEAIELVFDYGIVVHASLAVIKDRTNLLLRLQSSVENNATERAPVGRRADSRVL